MKDIMDLITTTEKYSQASIQKRFESKKHTVCYVLMDNQPRVLKWFAPGFKGNIETEFQVLQQASSRLTLPTIFEKDNENNVLIMGYIPGKNLGDILDDSLVNLGEKQTMMCLLAQWFAQFHTFFRKDMKFRIRGDPNVRNFLFNNQMWGVDFEESRNGNPGDDIGGLCASLLTFDPMFTSEKFGLCRKFIEEYLHNVSWQLEKINDEVAYAILEKISWRPEQEKILRNYAHHIRKKGL
jgi:tRNA A-37 threonylcarbamoyl transferase component Bud32